MSKYHQIGAFGEVGKRQKAAQPGGNRPVLRRFRSVCPNVRVFRQQGRPMRDEVSRWAAPALAFALVFFELNICAAATATGCATTDACGVNSPDRTRRPGPFD
jgi:hypothetical protein